MAQELEDKPVGYTRERLNATSLLILTGFFTVLSAIIAGPFVPGLTWALAFAVVAMPIHNWFAERMARDWAAGFATAVVGLLVVAPMLLVGWLIGQQAMEGVQDLQKQLDAGEWRRQLEAFPRAAQFLRWVEMNVDVGKQALDLAAWLQQRIAGWMQAAAWGTVQILIALFALYFFFRDTEAVLRMTRRFLPLSRPEADEFFERVRAMTHATVMGTLLVAAVQGFLSGLMFWILGLPGAAVWGLVMGLLAIIPVLGPFVVWAPAALFLAVQGNVGKAVILTGWGTLVVGLIDNLLYPVLVGREMRMHTLPVFLAIIGGLFLFGSSGLVLGPVVFASTVALLDILRRRTENGGSAEEPL